MPPAPTPAPDETRLLGPEARRSPDMQAVWDWITEQDAGLPDWLALPPAEARAQMDGVAARWNADLPALAAGPVALPGAPTLPATLFTPPAAGPGCILYLHGGGWAVGTVRTHERFMRLLALDAGVRVLGIDYRLAPEHPFPAPFEDCLAAWRALAAEPGRFGAEGGPLAVAGDSAGANLAAAVALHEVAEGRRVPDAALLFYGAFAADLDTPSYRRFAEGFGLTRAGMARFWDWYAPPGVDRRDPRLAPLEAPEAHVARLPPLFLNAAGLDPLLSDTLRFAGRLDAAGVPHELAIHEGVHHGFMQMSLHLPEARAAIRRAAGFLTGLADRRPG